jgi:molybdenum cofactor cytidylyltransferase
MEKVTALVILAAGGSSRLGHPKQQLIFGGKSLLQRAIEAGLQSKCQRPLVILGAYHEKLLPEIDSNGIDVLINYDWKEGMSSSIKKGIDFLIKKKQVDQVIFMLCDQPFVNENLLNQLISVQKESNKPIVACTYQGTLGVPVLFDKTFFPHLMKLQGREGAKKIIQQFPQEITPVSFPLGHLDIDTPEDYMALLKNDRR